MSATPEPPEGYVYTYIFTSPEMLDVLRSVRLVWDHPAGAVWVPRWAKDLMLIRDEVRRSAHSIPDWKGVYGDVRKATLAMTREAGSDPVVRDMLETVVNVSGDQGILDLVLARLRDEGNTETARVLAGAWAVTLGLPGRVFSL